MKVRNGREKCKDRGLWNGIVKQAKTHHGLQCRLKKKKKKSVKKCNFYNNTKNYRRRSNSE
jgi:hypothetical protein